MNAISRLSQPVNISISSSQLSFSFIFNFFYQPGPVHRLRLYMQLSYLWLNKFFLKKKISGVKSVYSPKLRLLTHVGFFSKTWSDTFKSVLVCEKEQEPRKKLISLPYKNIHLPEKV